MTSILFCLFVLRLIATGSALKCYSCTTGVDCDSERVCKSGLEEANAFLSQVQQHEALASNGGVAVLTNLLQLQSSQNPNNINVYCGRLKFGGVALSDCIPIPIPEETVEGLLAAGNTKGKCANISDRLPGMPQGSEICICKNDLCNGSEDESTTHTRKGKDERDNAHNDKMGNGKNGSHIQIPIFAWELAMATIAFYFCTL